MEKKDARNYKLKLLDEMKQGSFARCDRLPRETELAELLGISRTQLRDTLSELEREGYITRRHGVGTCINRHVLAVKNRMDIEAEFFEIIRSCGYTPDVIIETMEEGTADEEEAEKLGVSVGSPVLRRYNVCTADGVPAIWWKDVLNRALVKKPFDRSDMRRLIFEFLQEFCGVSAYMDLTELHPVIADEAAAASLQVPVGTPLLNMKETDFDIEGNPIFYSDQYFVDGILSHTVLRKKL
ncbi:MAG: GntR family transcriptional regulator [Oscillospiraceae bacterium]|nr:GntR family transcriptional regulator [Oscillospiraceae bacterium]